MTQALELVVRRFQVLVRDQQHIDLEARLDQVDVRALLVEQERSHFHRHLAVDRGRVFLHRLFLDDAQHLQGGRFGIADMARAVAARAGNVRALGQRRTQALARQLHQAEAADLAHLHAGAVMAQRVFQAGLHVLLGLARLHVDEVDHDQAAQVAQAQLAGNLIGCFEVGTQRGFLDVGALGGTRRVHVDGDQRFGMVDHDGAAGRQHHHARIRRFDLVFDLEAREQRNVVAVLLHPIHVVGHHHAHEGAGLIIDIVGIDQDLTDVRLEVVADGADHQARFEIDQQRRLVLDRGAVDRLPQLHQVVQVPLQLFGRAADAGGAGNDAHAFRNLQLRHGFAQFLTVFAFDPARHAAAARVVRHQHEIAAGQRDEGGQGRALVATLFLFHLDDQFLAFGQRVLDAGGAHIHAVLEVGAGDFLEGEETVPLFAVIDEAGFQRRFDAGDDTLVDVAFALFAPGGLDVDVDQFLAIDNGDAQFFLLRRIEQHAFHCYLTPMPCVHGAAWSTRRRSGWSTNCRGVGRQKTARRGAGERNEDVTGQGEARVCDWRPVTRAGPSRCAVGPAAASRVKRPQRAD